MVAATSRNRSGLSSAPATANADSDVSQMGIVLVGPLRCLPVQDRGFGLKFSQQGLPLRQRARQDDNRHQHDPSGKDEAIVFPA